MHGDNKLDLNYFITVDKRKLEWKYVFGMLKCLNSLIAACKLLLGSISSMFFHGTSYLADKVPLG